MPTEPCALCGGAIPEGGACRRKECVEAWKRYHGDEDKKEATRGDRPAR